MQEVFAFNVTDPSEQSESPLQPENVEPLAATAAIVTTVPVEKLAVHVAPQFIPVGEVVTVPVPLPAVAIDRLTTEDEAVAHAAFEYAESPPEL